MRAEKKNVQILFLGTKIMLIKGGLIGMIQLIPTADSMNYTQETLILTRKENKF